MNFSHQLLRNYCSGLPTDLQASRELLDDLGLEVKRITPMGSDHIFTLELLANRGDHHCYRGIAQEISARTLQPVQKLADTQSNIQNTSVVVKIETDQCLLYTATKFKIFSSEALKKSFHPHAEKMLQADGSWNGNALIDVTNFLNLEVGQPSHAFDADKIQGPITVRLSRSGEKAWLLFEEKPRDIPAGIMVIADDQKILAIAGVIGCEDSKVTWDTKNMILESACFDPVSVRKAGRALAIHTQASARFERGSNPELALWGASRIRDLLVGEKICEPNGGTTVVGKWTNPGREVVLRTQECSAFYQYSFPESEIIKRFESLDIRPGKKPETYLIPAQRLWDLETEDDLFEEIGRIFGYNLTPAVMPAVTQGSLLTRQEEIHARVSSFLAASGFSEIFTDAFYSNSTREKLRLNPQHPLWPHVETTNALDRSYGLVKNNIVAHALEAIEQNVNFKALHFKMFEWTRIFSLNQQAANQVCDETKLLWGMCMGLQNPSQYTAPLHNSDMLYLRGLVEELGVLLRLPFRFTSDCESHSCASLLHPYRRLMIQLDGQPIGLLGEIHPEILKNYKIKFQRPVLFEIRAEALGTYSKPSKISMPVSVPDVDRMLNFVVPTGVSVSQVLPVIQSHGPTWLKTISIADVFVSDKENLRSVTFRLNFDGETARTIEDFNMACEKIVSGVHQQLGGLGVKLR